MWALILGGLIFGSVIGIAYLAGRFAKFRLVRVAVRGKKIPGFILGLFLVALSAFGIGAGLGTINAEIVILHLVVIWLLCDAVNWIAEKKRGEKFSRYYAGGAAIAFTAVYLACGWFLANHVWRKPYTVETDKNVGTLRIVQFADSHVGNTFSGEGFARWVEDMQAENPDIVVITGDYVDDDTSKEDMVAACRALGTLETTYGVYYVFGNHDKGYYTYRGYSGGDLIAELQKNNVVVLQDETVLLDNRFYLIGRQDRSEDQMGRPRATMEELTAGLDPDKFSIVLDHQPHDYEAQEASGVDLVLSGHTHGGQLIPLNRMGEWLGLDDNSYGLEKRGNTSFIVTSGISDWAIQFKTGCRSEYVVIDVQGAQAGGSSGAEADFGASSDAGSEAETGSVGELTTAEIKQFTDFVNRPENNGFLLSQYDNAAGADLNQVFYNGAGMDTRPLSEEEQAAYEAKGYSVETDITRLSAEQIETFLRQKTGIGMADMTGGLDWVYLEDSDSYVFQHGDTNFCTFVCTGGTRTGELYELRFKAAGDYVSDCVTTLAKNGEDYRFVSNRFSENTDDLKRIRKIEEQSFSLELEGWGEVEFVSYEPDILEHFQQDVTFSLEQDGAEIFAFPEVRDGNQRVNDRFDRIEAVAFEDYDQDGYTDVIIICTYEQTDGEDSGTRQQEVRIYKGGERVFRYMDQLCFSLNMEGNNQSISQVLEEIGKEAPDFSGIDGEVRKQLEAFAEAKGGWVPKDYEPFVFGYTVEDLDGDGRLELLVQVMAGTGLYSENHFYQANEAGGIEELPQELYDGVSELDIGVSGAQGEAFRGEDGMVYYMASDITRNGYAESFHSEGAYYLKDGCVYSTVYRGLHMQAQGEDSWTETCYDAGGNEISRADWERLREGFLAGKEEIPYTIFWISAYPEDVEMASTEEIFRNLAECWQN